MVSLSSGFLISLADSNKSLESAKLIKKPEDRLTMDRKQKIKMNAERRMLLNQQKKKKAAEEASKMNEAKRTVKMKANPKTLLKTNTTLYGTSSVMASTLDKFKNNTKLDTTIILKQKNSQSHTIKKSNASNSHKSSLSSVLSAASSSSSSTTFKKSSIPKVKKSTTFGKGKSSKSNLSSSVIHSTTNSNRNSNVNVNVNANVNANTSIPLNTSANLSTQNILAGLDASSLMLGFNQSINNDKKNSILSNASSRSSASSYRGNILQNGEFPDIPSDYDDDENSRISLIATWAKTPNLLRALERQKDINPDVIFGGYKPCRLDEIFRGLSSFNSQPPPENLADSSILHDDES